MKYYGTAVLLSWVIVGGLLSVLAMAQGAYQFVPFYLVFVIAGGTVPALICALALKVLARIVPIDNGAILWALRGASLGAMYPAGSNMVMRFIGPVPFGSMQGSLSLALFGPCLLYSIPYGMLIAILAGAVNGLALRALWNRKS